MPDLPSPTTPVKDDRDHRADAGGHAVLLGGGGLVGGDRASASVFASTARLEDARLDLREFLGAERLGREACARRRPRSEPILTTLVSSAIAARTRTASAAISEPARFDLAGARPAMSVLVLMKGRPPSCPALARVGQFCRIEPRTAAAPALGRGRRRQAPVVPTVAYRSDSAICMSSAPPGTGADGSPSAALLFPSPSHCVAGLNG